MRRREALSALPSPAARALAFVGILLGGLAGGLIGYAFVDLQCEDGCATWAAVGAWITAVSAAAGTAVIAVLTLRAMGEWRQLGDRDHS
ncbi:MAG TPA: hypothetical protein VG478_09475 [Acidimicrobiales bacterium]|nr:hypothetical protein [Acidimicrobiales bacterium]